MATKHFAFQHLPTGTLATAQQAQGPGSIERINSANVNYAQIVAATGGLGVNALQLYTAINAQMYLPLPHASLICWGVRVNLGLAGVVPPDNGPGKWWSLVSDLMTHRLWIEHVYLAFTHKVYANGVHVATFGTPYREWMYLEVAAKLSSTTNGWIVIRVNGVEVVKVTGIQTVATLDATTLMQSSPDSSSCYAQFLSGYLKQANDDPDNPGFEDAPYMLRDTIGAEVTGNWTPSAGTDNADMVNDVTHDTDATHIETGTVDTEDQYETGGISGTAPTEFLGVVVGAIAKAPLGGAPDVKVTAEISSSKQLSAAGPVGTTDYRTIQEFFDASLWSGIDVTKANALRVGVKAA